MSMVGRMPFLLRNGLRNTPPSNPNTDLNVPGGFNSIRGGNQLYGTGANQGSGFVKDQLGNWHGTGALSGKTSIQMPYGGVSCR
jgi:hypothetical protein